MAVQSVIAATLLLVTACGTRAVTPSGIVDKRLMVPEVPTGNIVFYITIEGREVDPLKLTVLLDGSPLIRGAYPVGEIHPNYIGYQLEWPLGTHRIVVESEKADTRFEAQVNVSSRHWVVLYYGYGPNPNGFTLHSFDEPVAFK